MFFLHHFRPAAAAVGSVLAGMLTEAAHRRDDVFPLSGLPDHLTATMGKLTLTGPDLNAIPGNRFARIYPLYLALLILD